MKTCSKCEATHYAKGFCRRHYHLHRIETNDRPCEEPGCTGFAWSRGLCLKHYNYRTYRGTLPKMRLKRNKGTICASVDCEKPAVIKGRCRNHYYVLSRHGELETKVRHGLVSCGEGDCEKLIYAKGLCSSHYHRALRKRLLEEGRIPQCVMVPCENQAVRDGKCRAHLAGTKPNITKKSRPPRSEPLSGRKLVDRQKALVERYPDRFEWDEVKRVVKIKVAPEKESAT